MDDMMSMLELTFSPVRTSRSRPAANRPDKVMIVAVGILNMVKPRKDRLESEGSL